MRGHNVLVIGAGSIGERHLRCFAASGRADVSFVELNPERRRQVLELYPSVRGYESMQRAMESKPDVAVIATPAPLHVEQARELVERGVHVLIEKPLSVSMDGVEQLV